MALPLFDEPPPKRIGPGSPEYVTFWSRFRAAVDGQSFTDRLEDDPELFRYAEDGHRIGRLFRPLACAKEKRR